MNMLLVNFPTLKEEIKELGIRKLFGPGIFKKYRK